MFIYIYLYIESTCGTDIDECHAKGSSHSELSSPKDPLPNAHVQRMTQ